MHGIGFIGALERSRPIETDLVVMIGEIGATTRSMRPRSSPTT